ncbi:MAG: HPr(Ser) kinase/phosphatase [candidate division Zixibacteria bacterium]|nr:HPr(Ser) kinase/phosphatase [candidate division Zixibacteria bacterium]
MEAVTIERLLEDRRQQFELTVIGGRAGVKKRILNAEIHRPGLALSGYTDRYPHQRTQVLGETEMTYLNSLRPEDRRPVLESLYRLGLPLVVITKNLPAPAEMEALADQYETPLLNTRLSTTEFITRLSVYLDVRFAPSTQIHGTLVDVYGVGLLYTGKSGIGKSEVALDLIERGHRLVADDVVRILRRAPQVIIGSAGEHLGHHMEIRGVGIINVEKLFGIRAVRLQKRIEVEVRLELWRGDAEYERLGLEDKVTTILGAEIPLVTIPLSPGKNITVISEVIAMNHMLKVYGVHTPREFSRALSEEMMRRSLSAGYLESDTE